ncbi:hypothetical protein GFL88_05340 [Rhizobium leguminosarum bv. viciae]|nr:hypothetical protein [Rhizobium leguminosarum bv. viciae]
MRSVSVDGGRWIEIKPLIRAGDSECRQSRVRTSGLRRRKPWEWEISRHARKALFLMDCRFNALPYRIADIAGFTFVRSEA